MTDVKIDKQIVQGDCNLMVVPYDYAVQICREHNLDKVSSGKGPHIVLSGETGNVHAVSPQVDVYRGEAFGGLQVVIVPPGVSGSLDHTDGAFVYREGYNHEPGILEEQTAYIIVPQEQFIDFWVANPD